MMPEDFRAELIEGVVYVASPLKHRHSKRHHFLGSVFAAYEGKTPGVDGGNIATVFLGAASEPQPDLYLRILERCGGQSRMSEDDYVVGAPELVAEIAHSSRSIDLHAKPGITSGTACWSTSLPTSATTGSRGLTFARTRRFPSTPTASCGVRTFPGLWIDSAALFGNDHDRLMATLQQGLASPEHAAFVQRLAAAGPGKTAT